MHPSTTRSSCRLATCSLISAMSRVGSALRTTMLYALERESDHGSTSSVFVELSERGDVRSGPVPRVWNLPSNWLPLDQSLQRDGAGRTRRSQPSPAWLFPRDARAGRERDLCASGQASFLGRAEA